MAIKKSELYSHLWKCCDELRGGMDASQYKDYVLVLLFIKYVSDKYAGKPDAPILVPKDGSFEAMVKLKGRKDIGDKMNKIIHELAKENDLQGVIDVADFNDENKLGHGKEMQDRLSKLVGIFENESLNFSKNGAGGDDLLGDAYEYLMKNFATQSGKSKGQFYTPGEVSQVLAKVIGIDKAKSQSQTLYDPTCGSGSLLIKAADETPKGISIYGQEKDSATRGLAKMNMILHSHPSAEIQQGNTLANPKYKDAKGNLKLFDFVVANPPFSTKSWSNGFDPLHDQFDRFSDGIPPAKNGDYAFMLHIIRSLKSTGKGAVILPHGVLFRGNVEADIRKNVVKKGYIKGIISLPPNLFYGTGIPACIIVLDKAEAAQRKGIFMMDASKGFYKDGNKNRLRYQDIHKIVDVFNKQSEIPKYSRMVPRAEIEQNDFNLNIPRYIDSSDAEDIQDISAHLFGGIPNQDIDALEKYWEVFPSLKKSLFGKGDRKGYSTIKVEPEHIKKTIYEHPDFEAYSKDIEKIFKKWANKHKPMMHELKKSSNIKDFINELSENILQAFANAPLIDKYDIYQYLLNYWFETMYDDVHQIIAEGWQANEELIPKQLIIDKYFSKESKAIDELKAEQESMAQALEEMEEEHGGEEGCLEELKSPKGTISKGSIQERVMTIKQEILDSKFTTDKQKKLAKTIKKNILTVNWQKGIQDEEDLFSELDMLYEYLEKSEANATAKKQLKQIQKDLESKADSQYKKLAKDEVKELVIERKWLSHLYQTVKAEKDRISQALSQRIKELAERYETTLPELKSEVEELSTKVNSHIEKMGYALPSHS